MALADLKQTTDRLDRTTTDLKQTTDRLDRTTTDLKQTTDQLSSRVDDNSRKIDDNRRLIAESAAETRRHFEVIAEALHADIRAIAEAVGAERAERSPDSRLSATVEGLAAASRSTNGDVRRLSDRTDELESRFDRLDTRVTRLERSK